MRGLVGVRGCDGVEGFRHLFRGLEGVRGGEGWREGWPGNEASVGAHLGSAVPEGLVLCRCCL